MGRALRPAKAFLYRPVWQSGLWRPQDQRGAHSGDGAEITEIFLAFARTVRRYRSPHSTKPLLALARLWIEEGIRFSVGDA